ncbi:MAG: polyhydroxyalkanoate synthesis repressor PhaR [Gammaproteobacteria bacterium]|nr:polyhydroxyalkanoate synthesis repressor PhaR [Gammaproteobacteria bacterium]
MSEPRVIKKYPNRRLYDTQISSYITLEDVRKLVLEHVAFVVVDAKSKEDITRSILLQIIFEREEDGQPIFSTAALEQIVRFYGDDLQSMMTTFFESSLRLFAEQQHALRRQMETVRGEPMNIIRDMAERNMTVWREMQRSFLGAGAASRCKSADDDS